MRNVNPEWFYGWNREPETEMECEECGSREHAIEECEIARALDDDADMYREGY
jgi:hypothetical protein